LQQGRGCAGLAKAVPVRYLRRWGARVLRLIVLFSILVASRIALANDLSTRFGRVSSAKSDGTVRVSFEGNTVVAFEADGVSLHRVSISAGATEYVIIEKWVPGLHCKNEYFVISIYEDRSTKLSASFGACMKLEGASYARGVASIKLRTPPSLEGTPRFDTYIIENGNAKKKYANCPNQSLHRTAYGRR
jgi:hypothetical protein